MFVTISLHILDGPIYSSRLYTEQTQNKKSTISVLLFTLFQHNSRYPGNAHQNHYPLMDIYMALIIGVLVFFPGNNSLHSYKLNKVRKKEKIPSICNGSQVRVYLGFSIWGVGIFLGDKKTLKHIKNLFISIFVTFYESDKTSRGGGVQTMSPCLYGLALR